jgi:hypothetical protein
MMCSPTSQLDRTVRGVYSGCSTEAGVLVLPCHGLVRSGVACFSSNRKSVIWTKYKPTPNIGFNISLIAGTLVIDKCCYGEDIDKYQAINDTANTILFKF